MLIRRPPLGLVGGAFDVMFADAKVDTVCMPYRTLAKPGVRFLKQTITASG
jgi:hypothetical protein